MDTFQIHADAAAFEKVFEELDTIATVKSLMPDFKYRVVIEKKCINFLAA